MFRFVTASLSLGLFAWLSWMVFTRAWSPERGQETTLAEVSAAIARAGDAYGTDQMAMALLGLGIFISFFVIVLGPRSDDI